MIAYWKTKINVMAVGVFSFQLYPCKAYARVFNSTRKGHQIFLPAPSPSVAPVIVFSVPSSLLPLKSDKEKYAWSNGLQKSKMQEENLISFTVRPHPHTLFHFQCEWVRFLILSHLVWVLNAIACILFYFLACFNINWKMLLAVTPLSSLEC